MRKLLSIFALSLLAGCASCKTKALTKQPPKARKKAAPKPLPPLAIIDSHVHITPLPETINRAMRIFSQVGVEKFAVKSAGKWGSLRFKATRHLAEVLGEKMAFFGNVNWEGIDDEKWGQREADNLEAMVKAGASGIKIFKALGLGVRLKNGKLLKADDPRLDPIWKRAATLKAIVAWHIADPVAFFLPVDRKNERWDELSLAPDWSFHGKDYPSHRELIAARDRVLARFPQTTFLSIHFGNWPENLDYVDRALSKYKNLYVDISARIPEIGRHPVKTLRAFFSKHQDRVLFGTDLIVTPRGMQLGSVSETPPTFKDALRYYAIHRRFFETDDKNFDHPTPIQGRWKINGVKLPRAILKKIYYDNADRLIFAPRRAWLKANSESASKTAPPTKAR